MIQQGGLMWNNFVPHHGGAFNNGPGFGAVQGRGNGGFVPPNGPSGYQQNQQHGVFQDKNSMSHGRGAPHNHGPNSNSGYGGANYGPGQGWQRQHGRSRGSQGGRNPGGHGGREHELAGGRGRGWHQQSVVPVTSTTTNTETIATTEVVVQKATMPPVVSTGVHTRQRMHLALNLL